jgi:uncharacterized protein (TIGR03437 family)
MTHKRARSIFSWPFALLCAPDSAKRRAGSTGRARRSNHRVARHTAERDVRDCSARAFSGNQSPGGLCQVNVQVAAGIQPGNQPIVASIGGASSPASVLPVQ